VTNRLPRGKLLIWQQPRHLSAESQSARRLTFLLTRFVVLPDSDCESSLAAALQGRRRAQSAVRAADEPSIEVTRGERNARPERARKPRC
jgi:hypothetical protein